MEGEVREVKLKRSDSFGYGFSVFGGKGSGFPPVVYDVVENSPAAVSGELEAGDIILEVNDQRVVSLTTKEVLKSLRLSNDVVTLKVKKDTSIKEQVQSHMAASIELDALRRSHNRIENSNSSSNGSHVLQHNSEKQESGGDKENSENIPPVLPLHDTAALRNHTDALKPQTRPQQPKFETFMMTGDLIINLNTKTSNSTYILPTSNSNSRYSESVIPYGQCSIPTSPEEVDQKLRGKATKREASNNHSPVVEKKGSYSYSGNFVRTSRSEDHLQNVSVSTVNIDIEEDTATSLNTLLDPNKDSHSSDRIVWTYNSPVPSNGTKSPPSPSSPSEKSFSLGANFQQNNSRRCDLKEENIPSNLIKLVSENHRLIEKDQTKEFGEAESQQSHSSDDYMIDSGDIFNNISTNGSSLSNSALVNSIESESNMLTAASRQRHMQRSVQPKQDGVTNIVVDENKIYVKVLPDQNCIESKLLKTEKSQRNVNSPIQSSSSTFSEGKFQFTETRHVENDKTSIEENSRVSVPSPTEDESDVESLRSFHYSPKAIDMPSASRLAKRLYNLEGFKKSDVSRHLCKNNDFSRVVAEEYLKFFDFHCDSLDIALRKFLKQFCLIGETQERERVLVHFSKRFLDCNPGAFKSQDAVHTLTCALMLLNTDLHGENIGRRMTSGEFVENLNELNDGENFPKDVLKVLYHSIKSTPIEWAVDDDEGNNTLADDHGNSPDQRQNFIGHNPFLEVPNPNCATEYKKGYVMRKCCVDPNGKRTPIGKRGWKMFYATLRDLVLYLHKDENGFRKNQLYDSLHNSIRIHHSLATKAEDYTKKQHVFRLQTADQAEYLFQTSDSKELQSWIDTINYAAASLSAPPLAGGVGCSQKKFQRPLLPVSHTKLNLREQMQDIESNILKLEKELEEHLFHPPERSAKSRVVQEFVEKETFLQYELKRYRTYALLLRSKMAQFPELEPPLVETSIGEVDETEKSDLNNSTVCTVAPSLTQDDAANLRRRLSDRYSYRAAIYKTGSSEGI